jgi:hypothetical protein
MPKRISITTHLKISELEQLYRQAKTGVESRKARRGKLPPADFTSISSYMVISTREKNGRN